MAGTSDQVQSQFAQNILHLFPEVNPEFGLLPSPKNTPLDASLSGYDEEQIRLMDEQCIIIDHSDTPIGSASKKACHLMTNINQGLLHRAFSVFLFDRDNRLLLQQRASEKITFPDMWTNTCCSHPLVPAEMGLDFATAIEGAKQAAQRKLLHELGIPATQIPLDNLKFLTRVC